MKINSIELFLEELFPDARCELDYTKDYELLIAVVLSAQTTDKRVNQVTSILFDKYPTLKDLNKASTQDISNILIPIGTYNRKAKFVAEIASILINEYEGVVPNNREALEAMPGVGRKTTNVVLSNLFDFPAIAVDTHVSRTSKRLGLAKEEDTPDIIEQKLMKKLKKENWTRRHHQFVLFGRYFCTARSPKCANCKLTDICKYKRKKKNE